MTLLDLQNKLIKEIETILCEVHFMDYNKNKKRIKGYLQTIPIRLSETITEEYTEYVEPEKELAPFFIVKVVEADFSDEKNEATIDILFQIFDDDMEMQGYCTLFSSLEKVRERFSKNNVLEEYYCDNKFTIALQDNDTYPFFFAGMEMKWNLPGIEKEEFF